MALSVCATAGRSQIGGRTAADGPFVLEDAEDLDLVADGVMRDWVPDFIWPVGDVLSTLSLTGAGFTLAAGQTPLGALEATLPEKHQFGSTVGYISGGFGVPMPGVASASSADFPGDITSFETLSFLACFEPILTGQAFQVVLECYPAPDYPKIYWSYTPAAGTVFQRVEIDLWEPASIQNAGALTLADLLSQTRFLYFYCGAGPVPLRTRMELRIDDIRLASEPLTGCRANWSLYP